MSQVQPPRARTSRHRPATIQLIRSGIVNLGTLIITALLVRDAIMLAIPDTSQRGLRLVAQTTRFLIWPLERLSPLRRSIHGGLRLADVVTVLLLTLCWFLVLGIVAGWEHESRRIDAATPHTGLRP